MDQQAKTMADNLKKNTGKSLDQWITDVKGTGLAKHGEMMKWLKGDQGLTHGFANFVALKTLRTDADSAENKEALVAVQYQGKEQFLPLYEKLKAAMIAFGPDVEVAPKKAVVSFRRKKQFALLQPATKTRFEIHLNLKGEPGTDLLIENKPGSMCTHRINLAEDSEITQEIIDLLLEAYQRAE
jgi:predicted transport protein